MTISPTKSIKRILYAFGYSLAGLKATFITEAAFRQEIVLSIILIPIAACLSVSIISKVIMISSVLLILMAELINTAIEAVVDRISNEQHPLSKKAKDAGSALVLVAFVNAIVSWSIILIDHSLAPTIRFNPFS